MIGSGVVVWLFTSLSHLDQFMPIDANDPGFSQKGFPFHMLVSVNYEFGLCAQDIGVQALKPVMHFILLIMNTSWGIVRHQDVDIREDRKECRRFLLIIKKIPSGFVFP